MYYNFKITHVYVFTYIVVAQELSTQTRKIRYLKVTTNRAAGHPVRKLLNVKRLIFYSVSIVCSLYYQLLHSDKTLFCADKWLLAGSKPTT